MESLRQLQLDYLILLLELKLLLLELLMVLVLQALGPDAARHLAQFKSVLQAHGQDVDQHPTVDWAWSTVEKGAQT